MDTTHKIVLALGALAPIFGADKMTKILKMGLKKGRTVQPVRAKPAKKAKKAKSSKSKRSKK